MKINKYKNEKNPGNKTPCHSPLSGGIIFGPHRGSFAVRDHLRSILGIISGLRIICGAVQAPSTLIRFQTKTELFCSAYGYRPHYNAENDHRKRSHSKTLSSVDGENDAIWKRCLHQNRHDRAKDHSTVSIQNGGQALPCGSNFAPISRADILKCSCV